MKSARTSLLILGLGGFTVTGLHAAGPVLGAEHFKRTHDRIEALFHHRNVSPPPLAPSDNPFRPADEPASPLSIAPPGGERQVSTLTDSELLRQAVATLKVGGLVVQGDQRVIIINQTGYKEGGLLMVRLGQNAPLYLRIVSIGRDNVTIALNDATATLDF